MCTLINKAVRKRACVRNIRVAGPANNSHFSGIIICTEFMAIVTLRNSLWYSLQSPKNISRHVPNSFLMCRARWLVCCLLLLLLVIRSASVMCSQTGMFYTNYKTCSNIYIWVCILKISPRKKTKHHRMTVRCWGGEGQKTLCVYARINGYIHAYAHTVSVQWREVAATLYYTDNKSEKTLRQWFVSTVWCNE